MTRDEKLVLVDVLCHHAARASGMLHALDHSSVPPEVTRERMRALSRDLMVSVRGVRVLSPSDFVDDL